MPVMGYTDIIQNVDFNPYIGILISASELKHDTYRTILLKGVLGFMLRNTRMILSKTQKNSIYRTCSFIFRIQVIDRLENFKKRYNSSLNTTTNTVILAL